MLEVDPVEHETIAAAHAGQQVADRRLLAEEEARPQTHAPPQEGEDADVQEGLVEDVVDLALPGVQTQSLCFRHPINLNNTPPSPYFVKNPTPKSSTLFPVPATNKP